MTAGPEGAAGAPRADWGPPAALLVVVPARDEQRRLPTCLRALATAAAQLGTAEPTVRISLTVVLDSCVDASADVVAGWSAPANVDLHVVPIRASNVGIARAEGIAVARRAPSPPGYRWVACTDADSAVPHDWLVCQVAAARAGADVLTGLVLPERRELDRGRWRAWRQRHRLVDGHPHVHGANLGFRLDAYDRLGGFEPVATGEDVELVARAVRAGLRVERTATAPVRTSARRTGRAPAGFAAYLAALEG